MDKGIKIKGMAIPTVVPVQDPEVSQGHIIPLQQDPRRVPQVFHNQSLLLLPAPHKTGNGIAAICEVWDVKIPGRQGLRESAGLPRFLLQWAAVVAALLLQ